jgi:hypothetical protein
MQQMTGNIGLLNPLVLNPITATASYNPYAQVCCVFVREIYEKSIFFSNIRQVFSKKFATAEA